MAKMEILYQTNQDAYRPIVFHSKLADSFLKYKTSMELLPNNIKTELKSELNVAIKDNNLIYHEPIPDSKTLSSPEKTILAKPTAFDATKTLSKEPKDLFGSITPLAVASALEFFKQKKTELVSVEVARLREANDTLNGYVDYIFVVMSYNLNVGNLNNWLIEVSLPIDTLIARKHTLAPEIGINT